MNKIRIVSIALIAMYFIFVLYLVKMDERCYTYDTGIFDACVEYSDLKKVNDDVLHRLEANDYRDAQRDGITD